MKPRNDFRVFIFMSDSISPYPLYEAVPVLEEVVAVAERPEMPPRPRKRPLLIRFPVIFIQAVASILEWLFGFAVLMIGLAVLAALPILQLLSLGYLLESGGRVARTGRLRDGFIGVRLAARLGGGVAATWLLLLPVRFVAGLASAAQIIDPNGPVAARWRNILFVLIVATFLHASTAWARGGRLRYFIWPFNIVWLIKRLYRGGYYRETRDALWETTRSLRLPYYLSLGFRGFLGALAWLFVPVSLIAAGRLHHPFAPAVGFLGAALLALVLLYLPFLQMRLAAQNRFWAVFELGAVRADFRRAPYAFTFAFILTLLFALPLYLLKIEVVPREAAWLPSLVFIAFIFPARLMTGYALARAQRRTRPRGWLFRWTARIPMLPAAAFYVLIVFFTQYTSWNGVGSLFEQHAFLVPAPFFGM
jgi:hypothetical protein